MKDFAREHVAHYSAHDSSATPPKGLTNAAPARDIVLQTRLDAARNTMFCAQCHSFRDIYVQGYAAGADYYSYFMPVLEYDLADAGDPAYWPDSRTRRFSNDALGLCTASVSSKAALPAWAAMWRRMKRKSSAIRNFVHDANALCTRCRENIGKALSGHTHHGPSSTGSSCVECHMPRTVFSIKAEIRDHSMSIPVPENTIRHDIPNACDQCHKDRNAQWALARMNEWYSPNSRQQLIRRADAFATRKNDPGCVTDLLAIPAEPAEGPLTRGNAAGYLGRFASDPRAFPALNGALTDAEPLVRALAAQGIVPNRAERPIPIAVATLMRSLADPAATVRTSALESLVGLGVRELPGEDGERLKNARLLYDARAALGADDAGQEVAAGKFYFLSADPDRAITAFRASLKLTQPRERSFCWPAPMQRRTTWWRRERFSKRFRPTIRKMKKRSRLLKVILAQSPRF